jgi:hypothetical protein
MARLVAIGVFVVLQGAGAIVGYQFQAPVSDWMTGGHWVSPAVRVPLVVIGVIVAEIALLAAFPCCNRVVAGLCGCLPCESTGPADHQLPAASH